MIEQVGWTDKKTNTFPAYLNATRKPEGIVVTLRDHKRQIDGADWSGESISITIPHDEFKEWITDVIHKKVVV